jgi:hypothetical protein
VLFPECIVNNVAVQHSRLSPSSCLVRSLLFAGSEYAPRGDRCTRVPELQDTESGQVYLADTPGDRRTLSLIIVLPFRYCSGRRA